jgi:hypothetical protein
MHPHGSDGNCPDFEPSRTRQVEGQWEPQDAAYYGDELVITPVSRWTRAQRLELLLWHPLFTGLCPNCRQPFTLDQLSQVHWDCPACSWCDDSV